jgi:replicative DNA helicase
MRRDKKIELKLLATLAMKPSIIFDVDNILITRDDFAYEISRCIYDAVSTLAQSCDSIDPVLLEETVAKMFPQFYETHGESISPLLRKLFKIKPVNNIDEYIRIIITSSVKKKSQRYLKRTSSAVAHMTDHNEIRSYLEQEHTLFGADQLKDSEIICLGDRYESFVDSRKKLIEEGKKITISTGYREYDEALGGGLRRKNLDIVAARAKVGKSIWGLNLSRNVSSQDIPVLYLDTELDEETQMSRLLSIMSEVPIKQLETGNFFDDKNYVQRVEDTRKAFDNLPIDYIPIPGWNIAQQESLMRSWMIRRVGKDEDGRANDAVIILDYLKIMDPSELRGGMQEHALLGLYLSRLHDLCKKLDVNMHVLAQRNRSGIDEEHEGTIAGTDKFTWFGDSISFLILRRWEELKADYEDDEEDYDEDEPYNTRMKVVLARHGPGNKGDESIAMYSDINNPNMSKGSITAKLEEHGLIRNSKKTKKRNKK